MRLLQDLSRPLCFWSPCQSWSGRCFSPSGLPWHCSPDLSLSSSASLSLHVSTGGSNGSYLAMAPHPFFQFSLPPPRRHIKGHQEIMLHTYKINIKSMLKGGNLLKRSS